MKITFIGNCQLSRISMITKYINPKVDVEYLSFTPKFGNYSESDIFQALEASDIIISQPILNKNNVFNFDNLKNKCIGKLLILPYIYVDGLFSLSLVDNKVYGESKFVFGQESIISESLNRTLPKGKIINKVLNGEIDFNNLQRFNTTIEELKRREDLHCDFTVSNIIEELIDKRELPMITHNHPTPNVLLRMYENLSAELSLNCLQLGNIRQIERATLSDSIRCFSPYDARIFDFQEFDQQWANKMRKLVDIIYRQGDIS